MDRERNFKRKNIDDGRANHGAYLTRTMVNTARVNYFLAAQQPFFAAQQPVLADFFFAPQQAFFAAQQPFLAPQQAFFAAQQPFLPAHADLALQAFPVQAAIAGIAAIADAATTDAPIMFFSVLLKDVDFILDSNWLKNACSWAKGGANIVATGIQSIGLRKPYKANKKN